MKKFQHGWRHGEGGKSEESAAITRMLAEMLVVCALPKPLIPFIVGSPFEMTAICLILT